jgi:hypothetical protein
MAAAALTGGAPAKTRCRARRPRRRSPICGRAFPKVSAGQVSAAGRKGDLTRDGIRDVPAEKLLARLV